MSQEVLNAPCHNWKADPRAGPDTVAAHIAKKPTGRRQHRPAAEGLRSSDFLRKHILFIADEVIAASIPCPRCSAANLKTQPDIAAMARPCLTYSLSLINEKLYRAIRDSGKIIPSWLHLAVTRESDKSQSNR